jgi:hypothetical protein
MPDTLAVHCVSDGASVPRGRTLADALRGGVHKPCPWWRQTRDRQDRPSCRCRLRYRSGTAAQSCFRSCASECRSSRSDCTGITHLLRWRLSFAVATSDCAVRIPTAQAGRRRDDMKTAHRRTGGRTDMHCLGVEKHADGTDAQHTKPHPHVIARIDAQEHHGLQRHLRVRFQPDPARHGCAVRACVQGGETCYAGC